MKKLLALILCVLSLFTAACGQMPDRQNPSESFTSDESGTQSDASDESGTQSDASDESISQLPNPNPKLDDFEASAELKNRYSDKVSALLEGIDVQKYSYSEKLLVIGGIKNEFSFEETMAFLNLLRYTAKKHRWHEKDFLLTVGEEQSGSNAEDFEEKGLLCYDGGESPAIACDKETVSFTWLNRALAPKMSSLCGKSFDNTPTEEDFIKAAEGFIEAYFPDYSDYITAYPPHIFIDNDQETAIVTLHGAGYCLDQDNPDVEGGHYYPVSASLEFKFGSDELSLAGNGEKAVLHKICFYSQVYCGFQAEEIVHTNKKVITPSEAWDNLMCGKLFESCEGVEFEQGKLYWHSYYISYRSFNGYYQPCYTFICSQEGKGVFTLILPALEDMLETVFEPQTKPEPPKEIDALPIFLWDSEGNYYSSPIFIGGTNKNGFHTPEEFIYNGQHLSANSDGPIFTNAIKAGETLALYDLKGECFETEIGASRCYNGSIMPQPIVTAPVLNGKKPKSRFLIGSYKGADIFPSRVDYSDGEIKADLDCDGKQERILFNAEKNPDSTTLFKIILESDGKEYTVEEYSFYGSKYEKYEHSFFFADVDSDGNYEIIAYYLFNDGHETRIQVYDVTENGVSELFTQTVHYLN